MSDDLDDGVMQDAHLRQMAVLLCTHLPMHAPDARRVLDYARRIVDQFLDTAEPSVDDNVVRMTPVER
jgi:hypothetical protein